MKSTDTNANRALRWMLYGAYGYTGLLVIEEALARGHRPVLAGRDASKLRPLAEQHGLPWLAVGLDDADALARALADVDLVYHVAGPFTQTAAPMRAACLRTGTHYVDVTGESPVTADTFALDADARRADVLMLPSSGVNTVPTDAVAAWVARALPDATALEIAIDTVHRQSSGSLVSMLEVATLGGLVRRGGLVVEQEAPVRTVRFPHGTRHCLALPLADIHTAWHTTRVPDITAYVAQQRAVVLGMKWTAPVMRRVFARDDLKRWTQKKLQQYVQGPDAATRDRDRTQAWAMARNARGERVEAWLDTLEGYTFTAAVAPRIVEAALASDVRGVSTVAAAFGPDFVLQLPRTHRYTELRS